MAQSEIRAGKVSMRCKHKLPGPEVAGYATWDMLKEKAAEYPHMRPCPKRKDRSGGWNWIYRTVCEQCPDAAPVESRS